MQSRSDRLMSVKEARALLGIGDSKIYELMNAGQIKAVKLGSRTMISEAEVARYKASLPAAEWRGNYSRKAA